MSVERFLQINIAIQAVLATVLLGLSQQNLYLPLVALLAATVSVIFTDSFGWFRLNRGVANLFALVAAGYSLSSFFRFDKEQQLLAIANLLVYLQFILFFQQKTPRVYWQLMVLGLLQVVVAVALSLDALSAGVIVAYMVAGVSSLTLFFLHREALRVTGRLPDTAVRIRRRRAKSPAVAQPAEPSTKPKAVFQADPRALAWQLVGGRLVRQIAAMSLLSLLFTAVLFYTVPRRGDAIWQGPGTSRNARVAFSQEISFGETGLIEESDQPVLRVAFRDAKTGKPYQVVGRPYLRGSVLLHYSAGAERWRQRVHQRRSGGTIPLKPPPNSAELVRQEVVIEPSNGQVLFSVFPWWEDRQLVNQVAFDNVNERISISRFGQRLEGGRYRYAVLTDAFSAGWQVRSTPLLHDPYRFETGTMSARLRHSLTDMNADTRGRAGHFFDAMHFAKLREQADLIIDAAAVDPKDHLQVAQTLEEHFRTSDQYRYSLDFRNIQRDPALDPLEDFVVNHRTGHCEYYAGALALMLRSRDIPSRIVVGFAGGEYNPMGAFYQVRAKDAHAWVEAYIAPEHFDDEMLLPPQAEQTGVWYRLDPTPAAEGESTEVADGMNVMDTIDHFLDYFRFVWTDYIVGLDEDRQEQAVYSRLADPQPEMLGGSKIRSWMDRAARALGLASRDEDGNLRIKWPALALVAAGALLLWFVMRRVIRPAGGRRRDAIRRIFLRVVATVAPEAARRFETRWQQRKQRSSVPVEFYARLMRLVEPLGLVRKDGQTQQEFAHEIRLRLAQLEQADSIAMLPVKIARAFYQVRFGAAPLDNQELENIEQALTKLEQALKDALAS